MFYPVLLCGFAGLSTALGGLIVIANKGIGNKKMAFSQGFAAGVMLAVSLTDLLVESFKHYYIYMPFEAALKAVASLAFTGWIIGGCIENIALPKQIEADSRAIVKRMAVITAVVMVVHNLPEGVLTMFSSARDIQFGMRMAFAVALHNLPEGLAVASPVYYITRSRCKAFMVTFATGMAELFGGVAAYLLMKDFVTTDFLNGLMPVIAGIMCQAAVCELIPAGVKLSDFKHTFYGILCGIILISIGLFMF